MVEGPHNNSCDRCRADPTLLDDLFLDLHAILEDASGLETQLGGEILGATDTSRESARNLIHYLALRRRDNRTLQRRLASLGLASLGRSEAHVASTLEAILSIVHRLTGRNGQDALALKPGIGFEEGHRILRANTEALLGPARRSRWARIMVTMPAEAATDYALVRSLVQGGMDCMRINCAHDDPSVWARMAENLDRARRELSRGCKLLMDLAGPKLRTGPMEPGPRVVHWQPHRDILGETEGPALLWLTPEEAPEPPPEDWDNVLPLPADWLARLEEGDSIHFTDLRGAPVVVTVRAAAGRSRWAESRDTAYVGPETLLEARREIEGAPAPPAVRPSRILPVAQGIHLLPGDTLVLTRDPSPGRPVRRDPKGKLLDTASISCTLPEVFRFVKPGEKIWFDDGKIGGVVLSSSPDALHVRITTCAPSGKKLRADRGINVPDSSVELPALTQKDLADLEFVADHADLVGLSFVNSPADVEDLDRRLSACTSRPLGMVLKIETRRAFEQLPRILLASLRARPVGVMIARGDLAVECGYTRLAEVQEEILWLCEAAHLPVIWATQVLESMAKKGTPSRAEVTDAAMGERAECVMLNKGPHIIEAVAALDDILRRMESHQEKKSHLLRPLGVSSLICGARRGSATAG